MSEQKQTTIRFGDDIYRRLELASQRSGLPINSIVIVACMEWFERHHPDIAYQRFIPSFKRNQAMGLPTDEPANQ